MKKIDSISRRTLVKSSFFGILAVSIPNIIYSKNIFENHPNQNFDDDLFHRYPSIDDKIVLEVVGKSHFNLDRVKELVEKRPELARATWDWAFGDWETALGAASHVGRRDIAEFLIRHGARPDIFTFAMMGSYETVKSMIERIPGIQSIAGPHGISLLRHAKAGLRDDKLDQSQRDESNALIEYLESLGNAGENEKFLELDESENEKFLGDYRYGEGPTDGFTVHLNMRKSIALGKLGKSGGGLLMKRDNVFAYNGISSVEISFSVEDGKVISLTVTEPDLTLTARKVS